MADLEEPEWINRGPPPGGEHASAGRGALRVVGPHERPRLTYRSGREIRTRPVEFAWKDRFVKSEFNLVDGPPGIFKTTFLLWLAAQISRGEALPGETEPRRPLTTVMFSPEEDVGVSGLPKFLASGGIRSRFVEIVRDASSAAPQMVFPSGAALLDQTLTELEQDEHELGLLILDGTSVILEDNVSEHDNNPVKRALESLLAVTRRHGVTVVGVRHTGKAAHAEAGNWGIGSVAWRGMARSQWIVLRNPDHQDRYVFAPTKWSYAQQKPSSLVFEGRSADVALDDGSTQSFGTIEIVEESELSGQQWADRLGKRTKRKASKEELEAATAFLRAFLADGVMRPYGDAADEAKARAGIAKGVLWQAADALKRERALRFDRPPAVDGKEQPLMVSIPLARAALSSQEG